MSKTILELRTFEGMFYVTAFVGRKGDASIQLSTDKDMITLKSNQVKKLINVLQKRLDGVKGFRATDP